MKKLLVLVILVAALVAYLFWPGTGAPERFQVAEGSNAHRIADDLVSQGILRSRWPFLAWVRARHADQKIHVGRYGFARGRAAYWLVDDIIAGRTQKIRVVIPEGFSSWQIADRLGAAGVCDPKGFLDIVRAQKLEGFLFPATYDFEAGLMPATVVQRMKTKFDEVWTSSFAARAREAGFTKEQIVTLASIVEREVHVLEEGPTVAAVYLNRLKQGMRLEADPTVQYAKGEWVSRLTYADYRNTRSPYNTYQVHGLPPGPICSPGVNSLRSALWPSNSKALYFVAMGEGRHSFSETYREHTNKVNRRNRERRAAQSR
jgi:UPF0755 protein